MYDTMLTVRITPEMKKDIDKEVKKNRRWVSQSDLVKNVLDLYLTDPTVKQLIHKRIAAKVSDKWLDGGGD